MRTGHRFPRIRAVGMIFCVWASGLAASGAEEGAPGEKKAVQLIIEPASTKHSMATCNLMVGPLEFKEQAYRGTYEIKVAPFVFKNDHGILQLAFTNAEAMKMASGEPVEFTGKAVSGRDSKVKLIKGKTAPVGNDHGAVAFTVTTEDGDLLFNSTYRFASK